MTVTCALLTPTLAMFCQVTPADFTAGNTVTGLFTSPHFVIAMLSLMMLCFCVFVASFRRSSRRRRFEVRGAREASRKAGSTR